jgi:hypothetical protein
MRQERITTSRDGWTELSRTQWQRERRDGPIEPLDDGKGPALMAVLIAAIVLAVMAGLAVVL